MSGPRPLLRDTEETAFTGCLRALCESDPDVLAAVFVDSEGECVDYSGVLEPFESKVMAAQMQCVLNNLRPSLSRLAAGEFAELHIHAERYEIVTRRVDSEYSCVVVRRAAGDDTAMLAALDAAIDRLRAIAGLDVPEWDAPGGSLVVRTRASIGWGFAPDVIVEPTGELPVSAVLGRWEESGGLSGHALVCFRIHTTDGRDSTLVFDPGLERWTRW